MKLEEMLEELAAAYEEEDLTRRRLLFASLVQAVGKLGGPLLAKRMQDQPLDFSPCHQTADTLVVIHGRDYGEKVRRTLFGLWSRSAMSSSNAGAGAAELRGMANEVRAKSKEDGGKPCL